MRWCCSLFWIYGELYPISSPTWAKLHEIFRFERFSHIIVTLRFPLYQWQININCVRSCLLTEPDILKIQNGSDFCFGLCLKFCRSLSDETRSWWVRFTETRQSSLLKKRHDNQRIGLKLSRKWFVLIFSTSVNFLLIVP
jgi:hypothetical protein